MTGAIHPLRRFADLLFKSGAVERHTGRMENPVKMSKLKREIPAVRQGYFIRTGNEVAWRGNRAFLLRSLIRSRRAGNSD